LSKLCKVHLANACILTIHYSQNSAVLGKEISTEDAAIRLTDRLFKSVNQKMHIGGIFWDLAKAFHCMNHEILLTELHFYRV